MQLLDLDHYTIRVVPEELPALRRFYAEVLGLTEGLRPDFPFPGSWFYVGGRAVVHLAGNAPAGEAAPPAGLPTGRLNHVSLRCRGLAATRSRLRGFGLAWDEAPVPGMPLHQVFLRDPAGLKVELTFDAAELAGAGA